MSDKLHLRDEMLGAARREAERLALAEGDATEKLVQAVLYGIGLGSRLTVDLTHVKLLSMPRAQTK
jgi:hypothetical protein